MKHILITTILTVSAVHASAAGVGATERPNILFILTDDQGWWDVGMRGNKDIDTPVMDRLVLIDPYGPDGKPVYTSVREMTGLNPPELPQR